MARAIIALLTDFGLTDHYVGAMKGVILEICPEATLVDISHDLPSHDVFTANLELSAVYYLFPAGTIFLVVVDPGVGSVRRGLAVETERYRFIAPDNGVLGSVFQESSQTKAPKRQLPCVKFKAKVPSLKFPDEGSPAKISKRRSPSEGFQTTIPKRSSPSETSQTNEPKRKVLSETSQRMIPN